MTVTALLDLRIAPERLGVAPDVLRRTLADTRAFDGNLGVEVLRDATDETHLVVVETWQSLAHDDAYRAWRAGDGASDLGTLLSAPPVLTRLLPTDVL